MPKPPEPRAKAPSAAEEPAEPLAEVERALSILQGRHPDAVRAERETSAALAAKKAKVEAEAVRAAVVERKRRLVWGVAGVLAVGAATATWLAYARAATRGREVEAALAPLLAPYLAHGFSRVHEARFAQERMEVDVPNSTCAIAFAAQPAQGSVGLRVERPSGALEGKGSIAWCACATERATLRLADPSGGGIAALIAPAADLGAEHGMLFLEPRPALVAAPDECSRDALDAWIEKSAPVRAKDEALEGERRTGLARSGFTAVGSALPGLPFAVVPTAPASCVLAFSTAADDRLTLRLPGGERPIADARGPIGFCANAPRRMTIWRKGTGEVVVEQVGATRVGGKHGLRELSVRLGAAVEDPWVPDGDLGWDATSTLQASGVAAPEISVATDGHAVTSARVIALSIRGALVLADGHGGAPYACDPPLSAASKSAVCVQASALSWHTVGDAGQAGIAEATLPFWMHSFSGVSAPATLALELSLIRLGRRLTSEGFEATTLEGVVEAEGGAVVTGRAGDDAIVAVQLTREAPWASPCTTGEPWTLDRDPAFVSLQPGAEVKLSCLPKIEAARDRRTVVFRHVADSARPRR